MPTKKCDSCEYDAEAILCYQQFFSMQKYFYFVKNYS
jgi:hypothetical protein